MRTATTPTPRPGFGPSSLIAGQVRIAADGTATVYAGRREVARAATTGELRAALHEHFGPGAQLDGWGSRADVIVPLPMGASVEVRS